MQWIGLRFYDDRKAQERRTGTRVGILFKVCDQSLNVLQRHQDSTGHRLKKDRLRNT